VSIDLDRLIQHASRLAPLPEPIAALAAALVDRDADPESAAAAIDRAPALHGALVRVVGLAAEGDERAFAAPRDAVMRAGQPAIAAFAIALHVRPLLHGARLDGAARDDALWRHSVAAGLAAQLIPAHCAIQPPPEACTAALLHEVGKVLLCVPLGADLVALLRAARESGRTPLEAEWEVLEITHPELGGLVARHWGLPAGVIQGISLHHAPLGRARREQQEIARAVQLADFVAKCAGASLDGAHPAPAESEHMQQAAGIAPRELAALCAAVAQRLEPTLRAHEA
jgi:HD-like signal output (HDOD) protein